VNLVPGFSSLDGQNFIFFFFYITGLLGLIWSFFLYSCPIATTFSSYTASFIAERISPQFS